MNNRHRRDSNHKEIVKSLRQLPGISFVDLSQVGDGCPDLLVADWRGTALVEIKRDKKEKLRESQELFRKNWHGKIIKATTIEEIITGLK